MQKIFFTLACFLCTLTAFGQGSAQVTTLTLPKYSLVGSNVQVKGQVKNTGATSITSFKAYYSINNSDPVVGTVNVTVAAGATTAFTHPVDWVPSAAAINSVKVWITDINTTGGANSAASNGEIIISATSASQLTDKHVLIEYYSGEWCGWCPDGALAIKNIKDEFGVKVIASTIHQGDFMQNSDGNTLISSFAISGYPSGTVDRKSGGGSEVMNRGQFRNAVSAQLTATPQTPIGIDVEQTYNCNNRQLNVRANANFYAPFTENMRIMFFVQEDEVIGQGQRNFLNTTAEHPYQGLGDPIPNYKHKDVFRGAPSGVFGQAIGASITANSKFSKDFSYTIPSGYDLAKTYLVVAVVKDGTAQGQREIYNVRRIKLETSLPMLSFMSDNGSAVNITTNAPFTTSACPNAPVVSVTSSNQTVISNASLTITGASDSRNLAIQAGANVGTTNITITSTSGANIVTRTFAFVVSGAPTISAITNKTTNEDVPLSTTFTVGDDVTPLDNLTYTLTSSNTNLVTNSNIVVSGTGANKTLTLTPLANTFGTTTITIVVKDGSNLTAQTSFSLEVMAVNDLPTITAVADRLIGKEHTILITFGIADAETSVSQLTVQATSDNQTAIPNANLVLGGSANARTLTITSGNVSTGVANITITVTDANSGVGTRTFRLTIDPINAVENKEFSTNIKLYPNPSNRFVEVETGNLSTTSLGFFVYDLSGKMQTVPYTIQTENTATLDLKGLKTGTYLIEISNEKGKAIRKIVKQ